MPFLMLNDGTSFYFNIAAVVLWWHQFHVNWSQETALIATRKEKENTLYNVVLLYCLDVSFVIDAATVLIYFADFLCWFLSFFFLYVYGLDVFPFFTFLYFNTSFDSIHLLVPFDCSASVRVSACSTITFHKAFHQLAKCQAALKSIPLQMRWSWNIVTLLTAFSIWLKETLNTAYLAWEWGEGVCTLRVVSCFDNALHSADLSLAGPEAVWSLVSR